jgi:pimeloyl-ACP methyl ester carboxylesterase
MARFLATQGIGVVVIDNVGTGANAVGLASEYLTCQVYAVLYEQLLSSLREQLLAGLLPFPIEVLSPECLWCGIMGHSLGGFLATHWQGMYSSSDGLILLGWSNSGSTRSIQECLRLTPAQMQVVESALLGQSALEGQTLAQIRCWLRPFFYSAAVPVPLIEIDERDATTIPLGLSDCMLPGVVAQEAACIRCPIFLSFGGTDITDEPHREVTVYRSATAVTLMVQPEAHHCTNFEPSRTALWNAVASWCHTTARLTKKPFGWGSGVGATAR